MNTLLSKFKYNYNRSLKIFVLSNSIWYLVVAAICNVLQAIYFKSVGFDEIFIGNIVAVRTFSTAIFAPFVGLISNKFGRRDTVIFGILMCFVGYIGQVFTLNKAIIMLCIILSGIGNSLICVNEAPFISDFAKKGYEINSFSFSFIFFMLTTIIGSYLAGIIPDLIGGSDALKYTIIFFSFLSLIGIIPLLFIKNTRHISSINSVLLYLQLFKKKSLIIILVYNFLIGFGAGLIVPFLNIFLQYKLCIGTETIGKMLALAEVATIVGVLVVPLFSNRIGDRKSIVFCQGLSIPFMLIISASKSLVLTTIAFFARNALMNMSMPFMSNVFMKSVNENEKSIFNGLLTIVSNIARTISAVIAGFIMYKVSYEFTYIVASLCYALALVLFMCIKDKKEQDAVIS